MHCCPVILEKVKQNDNYKKIAKILFDTVSYETLMTREFTEAIVLLRSFSSSSRIQNLKCYTPKSNNIVSSA